MIVAARATEGQAHKGLAEGVDLLVDDVLFLLDGIVFGEHFGAE